MPKNWKKKLKKDTRVKALEHAEKRRRRQLSTDPMFVLQTEALKRRLEEHYANHKKIVADFFRQFSWPVAPKLKELAAFLRNIQDTALRETLREYVKHANRFRVSFVLRKRSPHFKTSEILPGAARFHVKIENGQLTPINPADEADPVEDAPVEGVPAEGFPVEDAPVEDVLPIDVSFASDQVTVPHSLDEAIRDGRAKFMQIDDEEGSSCLSMLERVAYFPEGITFVLHDAEQPYLFCLIGEKVSVAQWRKLSTAVTAMLREQFGRGKAGRPKDLQKRRQAQKLLKKPGLLKEKAFQLGGSAQHLATEQPYLSRLRKELKK